MKIIEAIYFVILYIYIYISLQLYDFFYFLWHIQPDDGGFVQLKHVPFTDLLRQNLCVDGLIPYYA